MSRSKRVWADRHGNSFRIMASLVTLFLLPMVSQANIWKATFGQQWFYEVRSVPGETLAGTWHESSLEEGSTYRISFEVRSLRGRMALHVGGAPAIAIDSVGFKTFDFTIASDGERRMIFRTLSNDVLASVGRIVVTERSSSSTTPTAGGTPGHYVSFSRERNLRTEMVDVLDRSSSESSTYHWNIANQLDAALTTPGVKGFSVTVDWRTVETGDGVFNWALLDANMAAARRYGLKFVVKILDRSFDGTNILPAYFPAEYRVWTTGGGNSGFVAKRWDPWVYTRIIRLYRAIANRYRSNPAFGGIATTESALGNFTDASYTMARYETALTQIMTQTQSVMTNGKLFWYLNFVRGDNTLDLNRDPRVRMARQVPHTALVLGGPDVTPDRQGMPGSATAYRIYARKNIQSLPQFCHLQHVDLGLGGKNAKNNRYRQEYINKVANIRQRESLSSFQGTRAALEFDTLDPRGTSQIRLHPSSVLGIPWRPRELFDFGQVNFDCDYVFWNYRVGNNAGQFYWPDVRSVITNTQYFYQW